MKEYNYRSKQTLNQHDNPLFNARKTSNLQNMQKSTHLSQTDKRIEQIKKKYDTPNRKEKISQLSVRKSDFSQNKQNENYTTADFKTRIPIPTLQTESSQCCLRDSKGASNSRQSFFNTNNQSGTSKSFMTNGINRQKQRIDYKLSSNKLYTNENEEQFFKRVKEMKQSLLYGQNASKQFEFVGSTFYPKESGTRSGYYESSHNVQRDRIDNIDKINQKIKGILECLNENQKTRIPSRHEAINKPTFQSRSNLTENKKLNLQCAETPLKTQINLLRKEEKISIHRQERSEILDKIEINKQFRNDNGKKQNHEIKDDAKWEKLSTKLEKYEQQNKLRLQKASEFSKSTGTQNLRNRNVYNRKQEERLGQINLSDSKKMFVDDERKDNRSVDLRDDKSRCFFINNNLTSLKEKRDRSLCPKLQTAFHHYAGRNGKMIDEEINRIHKKIQEFEHEKKKMGVSFTPFHYSNTKSSLNQGINNDGRQSKFQNDKFDLRISSNMNCVGLSHQIKDKYQGERQEESQTFREKTNTKQQHRFNTSEFSRLDSKISIKLQRSNPSSVRTSKFISEQFSKVSNERDEDLHPEESDQIQNQPEAKSGQQSLHIRNQTLKKQTDQGIEERKKKLLNYFDSKGPKKTELKELVKNLCDQVKIDEDFRNAKIWFEYSNHPRKEEQIRKLIPEKSIDEIREIMTVRESQNNPFFTIQGYESSFEKLLELYQKSEKHWKESLCKKFHFSSLQNQGFTCKQIDIEKKGHINLGDLVRFINLESGTFYRNRDLSLVFIRICKEHQSTCYTEVEFNWLRQTFCD